MNNDEYILSVGDQAKHRLTIQHELFAPTSYELLERAGLRQGMQVLDVGCGSGIMTDWLAKKVGDQGKVIGIDSSAEQIAMAKRTYLSQPIQFKTMNVLDVANHFTSQFDLIYCRLILSHLDQPKKALQQVAACLKPNGIIVCEETVHDACFCYPKSIAFEQMFDLINQLLFLLSKNKPCELGYRLYHLCKTLSLQPIAQHIVQPLLQTEIEKQLIPLTFQEVAPILIAKQLIQSEAADELLQKLKTLINQDPMIGYVRITQLIAKKIN